MVREILWLIAVCAALSASALSAEEFSSDASSMHRGGPRIATVDDLRPHIQEQPGYTETWAYHVYLEGDVQLFINFSRANLGSFKGEVSGADLSIVGLNGRNYAIAREFPAENLNFEEENHKLSVHRNIWFSGQLPHSHHVHYETAKKGMSYLVDLVFDRIEPGVVSGDGIYSFAQGGDLGVFIHIPYATVSGTIAVNGQEHRVKGTAYMDHMFQTIGLPKLLCCGFRYIRHDSDWEVGSFLLSSKRFGSAVAGYGLKKTDTAVELLTPRSLTVLSETKIKGARVAEAIEVLYSTDRRLHIDRIGVDQRLSVFSELGGFVKTLARIFVGGELIYYRAPGKLDRTQDAHLNYFVVR